MNEAKLGPRNRVARGNANGIPDISLENANLKPVQLREFFAIVWDAGFSACYSWIDARRKASSMTEVPAPANPLKNDKSPVDYDDVAMSAFALAVSDKLARKRVEYPSADWLDASPEDLSRALREHVAKGDPIDVAAYCMFLHQRGYKICPETR